MIIYTKYSNERSPEFSIRTDIFQEENRQRKIRKTPFFPQAAAHVRSIYTHYLSLKKDLEGTGLSVNPCEPDNGSAVFPYIEGNTLEERLDGLLAAKKLTELEAEIGRYFEMFVPDSGTEFHVTPEFERVFGSVSFETPQVCRPVSDIDMIFSNAIGQGDGFELIDYEWTFDFLVPVKYIQYRCLHYYIYGNTVRDELIHLDLYSRFGISRAEREQFERMEKNFQQYMLGNYTPHWKLYDAISDGVIDTTAMIQRESADRRKNAVEIYFDDGRSFGTWSCERRSSAPNGRLEMEIVLPEGTRAVRIDPCGKKCVVRVAQLSQGGRVLPYTSNGYTGGNGDLIFDTEDPQIIFDTPYSGPVTAVFYVESMDGITRELILNQYGKLRRLQPKVMLQKVKKILIRR